LAIFLKALFHLKSTSLLDCHIFLLKIYLRAVSMLNFIKNTALLLIISQVLADEPFDWTQIVNVNPPKGATGNQILHFNPSNKPLSDQSFIEAYLLQARACHYSKDCRKSG